MMTMSVRFLLVTQAAAALFSISMLCTCSNVHAADEVPAAAAAPAAKAGPAGDPDFDDERLTDSELGRAVAMLRKDPRKAAKMLEDLAPKMPWLDDVIAYYTALALGRSDHSDGR